MQNHTTAHSKENIYEADKPDLIFFRWLTLQIAILVDIYTNTMVLYIYVFKIMNFAESRDLFLSERITFTAKQLFGVS